MLIFKKFFALLALLSLSMGANASVANLGTLTAVAGETVSINIDDTFVAGDVNETHTFAIDTAGLSPEFGSNVMSLSFNFGSGFITNIDSFLVSILDNSGAVLATAGSNQPISINPAVDGNYSINFTGNATGSGDNPGHVIGAIALTTVPVPAAAWLFGSAMLGLVGVSRSRKATV